MLTSHPANAPTQEIHTYLHFERVMVFKRKKPVVVKCYSQEEVGNLLDWLRADQGYLSEMHRQRYTVTAVMAMSYWDNPQQLLYFEVTVPYYQYTKLREKFIQQESFDPILEQRVFNQILGRPF